MQNLYGFPNYNLDLENIFGSNYKILSSAKVYIAGESIRDNSGNQYQRSGALATFSADYGPALWNPTTCNYSSRNGTAISAVAIHDIEGTYSSCISWFKNCNAQASAHYVLRSSDGQITQMILESNKAWHVGSENPYSIGLEHEGYASQTGWYTSAMYNASAGLVRDITNSGYGISPLRTYSGPSSSSGNVLGSCIKIKGHQHFPNQTHVDPGINWNWASYYMLINPNPAATTLTTCSGTIYDSGGSGGNYTNDERKVTVISPAGASSVTINFTSFNTEAGYDYVYLYNGNSVNAPLIGKYSGTTGPGTVTASSGAITVEFRSDCATVSSGYAATWSCSASSVTPANLAVTAPTCTNGNATFTWNNSGTGWYLDISTSSSFSSYSNLQISNVTSATAPSGFSPAFTFQPNTTYYWRIFNGSTQTAGPSFTTPNCDITAPTTSIAVTGSWQSTNFTASFTDADNSGGSGLNRKFYQVLDYNGTEWRANGTKGFFNDNFNSAINSEWLYPTGTWSINSGWLNQSDEANSNSNIYAAVTQTSTNKYMYAWSANMTGTGTNRRSGLHFMIDDPTTPNRGNSYLVWFRVDQSKLEFYEIVNDVLNLTKSITLTVNANQWYQYKVVYDPATGVIEVWRDNVFIDSWTDATPLTTGNYISLRNGNSNVYFDDVKVYRSRTASASVTIGSSTADVRYQNSNSTTASCRIKSIVTDIANNISSQGSLDVNIDWTAPTTITTLNDGTSSDIDTTYNTTQLSANWSASTDPHSAVTSYWYAIGTTAGATNTIGWTNNGTSTTVSKTGLTLTTGQKYYFTVKAEDGAGLISTIINSDGQLVMNTPPADVIAPTTSVTAGNWQTQNFTASFTDADNSGGSGVSEQFYQVMDYNGTEFRANGQRGFFNDNFSTAINAEWTTPATYGTWAINSSRLNQTDEAVSNTNIYTAVSQNSSNKYLYNWQMNIGGTGTNRRAGLHFFVDNPALPNRGNSYMVWFRVDQSKLEFYRISGDTLYLRKSTTLTVTANAWNDYKVIYDPATGKIDVYRDNTFIDSYTDPNPLTSGAYISLRNGNSNVLFDDMKVYHSRSGSATVTVGTSASDVRYQNPSPSTPSCRINSIIRDAARNISAVATTNVNIDWTAPASVTLVKDGNATDIDTTITPGQLAANWSAATDTHSGVSLYEYSIGTSPGDTSVTGWTSNTLNTSVTRSGLSLVNGTTYYFNIRSRNNAGLVSGITSSDGQTYLGAPVANFDAVNVNGCPGDFIQFNDSSSNATAWTWTFNGGFPTTSTLQNPIVSFTPGTHSISLTVTGPGGTDSLTRTNYITIGSIPVASFGTNDTVITLPSAIATFTNTSGNATSYEWNFGDGTTSASPNPSHMYTVAGTYTVTLVAMNGTCPNDTMTYAPIIVQAPNGISELNTASISTYPNPFSSSFDLMIDVKKSTELMVIMRDVLGKSVYLLNNENLSAGTRTIHVTPSEYQLASGVYMIEIKDNNTSRYLKVISK
jgi:PKD repeat protein